MDENAVSTMIRISNVRCGMRRTSHSPTTAPQTTGGTMIAPNTNDAVLKR